MSSILDALQRAEAERLARDGAPPTALRAGDREAMARALQSPGAADLAADLRTRATPGLRVGLSRLMSVLAVLGLVAAGLWTWRWWEPVTPVPQVSPPLVSQERSQSSAGTAPDQRAPAARSAEPPLPAKPKAPVVGKGPSVVEPGAARTASPSAAAPAATSTPAAWPPAASGASTAATAATATAAATASSPVVAPVLPERRRVDALSAAERQMLGPLTVQGVVQSAQASSRLLMVNGLVLREGEAITPSLILVRISPEGAELRWQPVSTGAVPAAASPQVLLLSLPQSP